MELQTISQVTKALGISTRMLRYYEEIGLLKSTRMAYYAYRVYDENAQLRLRQILILRKLRLPLKQIAVLLDNADTVKILNILMQNISELNAEITSLSTIRTILEQFVTALNAQPNVKIIADLINDEMLFSLLAPLSNEKLNFKEEKTMENLQQASEQLNKLTDKDVRIVYLPPATVVSSHYFGDNPEDFSGGRLRMFIEEVNLPKLMPGFRVYGFNNPSPSEENATYGYEFIATIPDDLAVSEPLVKKQFDGGLYMAYGIKIGDFHFWQSLYEYASNNDLYEIDWTREPQGMQGFLEEHLNAQTRYTDENQRFVQLDLLIPVKKKG